MRLLNSHQSRKQSELFVLGEINQFFDNKKSSLADEIMHYDANSILNLSEEELKKYFLEKYQLEAPKLLSAQKYMEKEPEEVTVNGRGYDPFDHEPITVSGKAVRFTICIPFEGDQALFRYRPSRYSYDTAKEMNAALEPNEVRLHYQEPTNSQQPLEQIYEHEIGLIETNLRNIEVDVSDYNQSLPQIIQSRLNERKKEVAAKQAMVNSIKIPIKLRSDLPSTYAIPEVRRKPKITTRPPTTKAQKPEPTLVEEEYEQILNIVKDMSLSMERSPDTFAKLSEEEIRDFFLIHLNGHYQGSATGETFNGSGKTDILIRHENANAFIAECKFWTGSKGLSEAIDQLLTYVTWRDTKTAIILFNKGKDLTSILEKIETALQQHPNFKSKHTLKNSELHKPTIFGYKFNNPHDKDKEIFLSVLAFQVANKAVK